MKRKRGIVSVCALALVFALAGCNAADGTGKTENDAGQTASNYSVTISETEGGEAGSSAEMLAGVRTTVVDVTSETETGTSAGSGVVIGVSGEAQTGLQYFIVTNHHVIDGGKKFSVDVLSVAEDGTESTTVYDAALVGSSFKRDVAVLSVRPPVGTLFSVASFLSDSDSVKVGTEVFAIGNPLGILGGTVSHGIVSATKRTVNVDEIGTMTLLQTDASINGGNSGGGLFDSNGALIGIINSGYDSYNGVSVEGLNFAIPANDAKYAASELIRTHTESGGQVTGYGYVEGDAEIDVVFSSATLYVDANLSARTTCLVAAATDADSQFYGAWGGSAKVVSSLSINGEKTDFSESGSGSYALTERANELIMSVRAGDEVTVEYRNVFSKSAGGYPGFFGRNYNYIDGEIKEVSVTAQQYVYEP